MQQLSGYETESVNLLDNREIQAWRCRQLTVQHTAALHTEDQYRNEKCSDMVSSLTLPVLNAGETELSISLQSY